METSTQTRQGRGYLMWLVGGMLGAGLIWATLHWNQGKTMVVRRHSEPPSGETTEELRRLRREVLALQGKVDAVSAEQGARTTDVEGRWSEESAPSDEAALAGADEEPEPTEERLMEQTRARTKERFSHLEKRFSDEPTNADGSGAEEASYRDQVKALEGYELSTVECRYTMCRLEVTSNGATAADVLRRLDLTDGGEVRRGDDGTFLVFAGREGFPFHEFNGPD